MASIETLNLVAAGLHAAQAVTVAGLTVWLDSKPRNASAPQLFDGGHIATYRTATIWHKDTSVPMSTLAVDAGTLDIRYLMIAFFALSALFQGAASLYWDGRSGLWRYVEYSFSASIMVLAIAGEAGIRDAYTLACMFLLTWITQVLGILADMVQTSSTPWTWLFPHLAGWITCLGAYWPILDVFLLNVAHSELQPPDFVRVIVFLEFALFICFGGVQAYTLTRKARILDGSSSFSSLSSGEEQARMLPPSQQQRQGAALILADIDDDGEILFISLSLAAKTLLCWIVLSPLLRALA